MPAGQSSSGRAVLLLRKLELEKGAGAALCGGSGAGQQHQHRRGRGNWILEGPVASADPGSAVVARLCFLQSSFLKVLNGAEQGSSACADVGPRRRRLCARGRSCWWQGRQGRCWGDGRCSWEIGERRWSLIMPGMSCHKRPAAAWPDLVSPALVTSSLNASGVWRTEQMENAKVIKSLYLQVSHVIWDTSEMKPEGPQDSDAKHDSYVILHQGKQRSLNRSSQIQLLLLSLVRQFALWDMNSNRLEENFTTWSYLCNSLYILWMKDHNTVVSVMTILFCQIMLHF